MLYCTDCDWYAERQTPATVMFRGRPFCDGCIAPGSMFRTAEWCYANCTAEECRGCNPPRPDEFHRLGQRRGNT